MKYRYLLIFAIFLVLAAVSIAGCCCCSSTPSFQGATSFSFGSSATATPASTTTAGSSTLGSMIDFNKVHWYEYQMNTDSAGTKATMTMRQDLNVDYQGKKANKITLNMDMGSGSTMNMISYTDVSTGATLGGHMKMTANGQTIMDQDLEPGANPSATPGVSTSNPLQSYVGTSVTNSGTESVTVPAGTYTATKYTWDNGGATGNAWVAPNVPIPVKMAYTSSDSTVDMQLTGWG